MSFFKSLFYKSGDQLARKAMEDYDNGRDEFEVIENLEKAILIGIKKYPLDKIYLHIGASYSDLSIYDKSIEAYQKALEINPKNSTVLSNLGQVYNKVGTSSKSLELYQLSIQSNPGHSFSYHNLGVHYYESGDPIRGLENFEIAIKLNPLLTVSYAMKARCLASIGQYSEAKKFVSEAKMRGYDNIKGLKQELQGIYQRNPQVLYNKESFIELVSVLCFEDYNLIVDIQNAINDPISFYKANQKRMEEMHLTAFEIYHLMPFKLLIDNLEKRDLLIDLSDEEDEKTVINEVEWLLDKKYSWNEVLFEDIKEDYSDLDELLGVIATTLKQEKGIELIDIFYDDSQRLITAIDSSSWKRLNYPFNDHSNCVGIVRSLATT